MDNGIYHLEYPLESLLELDADYGDNFKKFQTSQNRKNPFRIEVSLEKENAPEGTIALLFGKWAVAPYTPIDAYLKKGLFHDTNLPKYTLVSFRPEKIHSNAEIICQFTEDLGYKPTHIRFGNDAKGGGYIEIIYKC